MAKVFVINDAGHDFSMAEQYGELVVMTKGSFSPFETSNIFRAYEKFIAESSPDDYILLSGYTVMSCIACSMFASRHGKLNLLIYKHKAMEPHYVSRRISFERVESRSARHKGRKNSGHSPAWKAAPRTKGFLS
ncbi:MAG: hypothetical protein WC954_05245 [Sphaerochaeta sp.]